MKKKISRVGVLTSGGDSPGMNAAIRAVTRTAIHYDIKVSAIYRGYQGLIEGDIVDFTSSRVGNILHRGGTILKSARSPQFHEQQYRAIAAEHLRKAEIDALVVIGGDGTFAGANIFQEEHDLPIVGLPGTIDNDLYGTDYTIGYDTALNTIVEAIDKIRDTAHSHHRLFFVEVMGRDAGFVALRSGIAVGAGAILIPEKKTDVDDLIRELETGWRRNKQFGIIVVAEGDDEGGAFKIAQKVQKRFNQYDIRVSILGHMQRGGNPSCKDRVLASMLGKSAVDALVDGHRGVMIGEVNGKMKHTAFEKAIKHNKHIDKELLNLAKILSS